MPYSTAVAVVSCISRRQCTPAISDASFIASRCALLNQHGMLTTASARFTPHAWRASSPHLTSIMLTICVIENCFGSSLSITSTPTPPSPILTNLTPGTHAISYAISGSSYCRPIMRFIALIVFL